MHADFVRSLLPPNVVYGAVPDAGFFLDSPNTKGQYVYTDKMRTIANISAIVSDVGCMAAHPSDSWRCMMSEFVFPHITSSLHMIQSSYDSFQLGNVLQLDCIPSEKSCSSADLAAFQVQSYRRFPLAACCNLFFSGVPRDDAGSHESIRCV
jgi:ribosome maturation protein SDO1